MKWTVGAKIGTGFGLVAFILVVVGAVSVYSLHLAAENQKLVRHTLEVIDQLDIVHQGLSDAEALQRNYLLTGKQDDLRHYQSLTTTVRAGMVEAERLTGDNTDQQQNISELKPVLAERLEALASTIEVYDEKGLVAAQELIKQGRGTTTMEKSREVIDRMRDIETGLLTLRRDEYDKSASWSRVFIISGTVIAFLISTIAGISITRNIAGPLRKMSTIAGQIADGDLAVGTLPEHRSDEVGVLARSFTQMTASLQKVAGVARKVADGDLRENIKPHSSKDVLGNIFAAMIENLRKLNAQLIEGVNVLGSSANQISTSTTQFAYSASETATAVSETTTTVEEVRQTVQLSNEKAKLVSDTAQRTAQISRNGIKSTEDVSVGMDRIRNHMTSIASSMVKLSEQSQTIGQIVATVEDLAEQSNLLAVNASIEAAKAGEQGKGFGVVAQEVRSLAEQSKQATRQVRTILSDIQKATSAAVMATEQGSKAVEAGVAQVAQAGESIQTLASSVNDAANVATQIAASSQQQLVGVDQVASAMESIKQASTQNVASAKQLEAAAHDLKELGHKLKLTVDTYKL